MTTPNPADFASVEIARERHPDLEFKYPTAQLIRALMATYVAEIAGTPIPFTLAGTHAHRAQVVKGKLVVKDGVFVLTESGRKLVNMLTKDI